MVRLADIAGLSAVLGRAVNGVAAAILAVLCVAGPVFAQAPETSPWPVPRPDARPDAAVILGDMPGLRASLRPVARPVGTLRMATASAPGPSRLRTGAGLCGNPTIVGRTTEPVMGNTSGCFILNPVKVLAVEGVQLSHPITVDCPTAQALADRVRTGVKPVFGNRGGGVAVLQVVGSYSCRTRNSQPGARLSEHARGRAVDISGFRMFDGQLVSVLQGWRKRSTQDDLRKIHALACGPFGTVLGPNADSHHQDHFHVDTANRRGGGSYCR